MSDNHVQEDLGSAAAVVRSVKRGPLSGIRLAEVPPMPVFETGSKLIATAKAEKGAGDPERRHLVLSCERDEPVHFFGPVISVWVNEVRGNKVRLSIVAPETTRIYRDKVFKEMRAKGLI